MSAPEPPTFAEPWQAQIFAMAVHLSERGLFTWSEWTQALGAQIAAGPQHDGETAYFDVWLNALEAILVAKGVAATGELRDLAEAWRAAARATPHGRPIVLGAGTS